MKKKRGNMTTMKTLVCKKVVDVSKKDIKGSLFNIRSKNLNKRIVKNQSLNYIEQLSQDDSNIRSNDNKLNVNKNNSISSSNNNSNEIDYKSLYEEAESMNLILQLKINYLNAKITELFDTQQHVTLGLKNIQSSILDCMILDQQETEYIDDEIYYENNNTDNTDNNTDNSTDNSTDSSSNNNSSNSNSSTKNNKINIDDNSNYNHNNNDNNHNKQ